MNASGRLREEGFLEQCFVLLSKYSHDKLKELVEKEKEDSKNHISLLWSLFLHLMLTFTDLEKNFYSLAFIGPSNFGSRWLAKREPTLKMRYSCLLTELRKIETAHRDQNLLPTDSDSDFPCFQNLEQLVSNISIQLQHFVVARMNTISFYEQLPALTNSKNVSVEDLLKIINSTLEEFLSKTYQPIVLCFKDTYRVECEAVMHLLKVQIHLQKCQYMESLMSLICANKHLNVWCGIFNNKEVKKLTFVNNSNKTSTPELFEWLIKFKGFLLSKFNLYFYEVLCQNGGNPSEVRNNAAKAPMDFYSRITSFFKKADAHKILLVLTNLDELEESSKQQGYFLPVKGEGSESTLNLDPAKRPSAEDQPGLQQSFSSSLRSSQTRNPMLCPETTPANPDKIVIFEYPPDKQDKPQHFTNYLSTLFELLDSKSAELEQPEKIVCSTDATSHYSFIVTRIEGSIHLVTVMNKRYCKIETYLSNFYTSLSSDLRCNKLFVTLKQGCK